MKTLNRHQQKQVNGGVSTPEETTTNEHNGTYQEGPIPLPNNLWNPMVPMPAPIEL